MIFRETNIKENVISYFLDNKDSFLIDYIKTNDVLKKVCRVNNFFNSQNELDNLFDYLNNEIIKSKISNRREFGDFQTNDDLSLKVVRYVYDKVKDIEFILEPTCGKGSFIISSLLVYDNLKRIVGVEIHLPYVWETKFNILSYYLINKTKNKSVDIEIIHANAFDYSYQELSESTIKLKSLVIGNPPWVTNSELSSIDSTNLPTKSNFKNHSGFEAITGKGNFDIGEYISLIMLKCFQYHNGVFAFLIKNSVIRNLINDQKRNQFQISRNEKLNIDSKKEFNASVNASLFYSELNNGIELTCNEIDFYSSSHITYFGWYKDKFVNSINDYDLTSEIDGESKIIWRSGVKHDCSKIMELNIEDGKFVNGLNQELNVENELVYGLLKSSDLKDLIITDYRKSTIITQRKVGQETDSIKENYPLTYQYLLDNESFFNARKSSIYKDKPKFSIFGIGEYSFSLYKVGISSMYKTTHFSIVMPENGKPIMLDDTCYFIGFDNLEFAMIAQHILNSDLVQSFIKSIIFPDAKRIINKDILMRIDLRKAFVKSDSKNLLKELKLKNKHLIEFGEYLDNVYEEKQKTLF
jgi:hypothetical protein